MQSPMTNGLRFVEVSFIHYMFQVNNEMSFISKKHQLLLYKLNIFCRNPNHFHTKYEYISQKLSP